MFYYKYKTDYVFDWTFKNLYLNEHTQHFNKPFNGFTYEIVR